MSFSCATANTQNNSFNICASLQNTNRCPQPASDCGGGIYGCSANSNKCSSFPYNDAAYSNFVGGWSSLGPSTYTTSPVIKSSANLALNVLSTTQPTMMNNSVSANACACPAQLTQATAQASATGPLSFAAIYN